MDRPGNAQNTVAGALGTTNGQPGPKTETTAGEDVWDEERLEKAMARLKEMHIQVCLCSDRRCSNTDVVLNQLRNLRTTVPRLLEPLTKKQPSRMPTLLLTP